MVTVRELRAVAKKYELPIRGLRKDGLIKAIADAQRAERRRRISRAIKTGRLQPLGGTEPHKKAKRERVYRKLNEEVDASLRAQAYEKRVNKNPALRLPYIQRIAKRIASSETQIKESLAGKIAREGPRILDEMGREAEEKGRRIIRWRFSRGLSEDLTPQIMTKIRDRVQSAFYLRYIYTYQIRNIENGKHILFHIKFKGSPWIIGYQNPKRIWQKRTRAAGYRQDRATKYKVDICSFYGC